MRTINTTLSSFFFPHNDSIYGNLTAINRIKKRHFTVDVTIITTDITTQTQYYNQYYNRYYNSDTVLQPILQLILQPNIR